MTFSYPVVIFCLIANNEDTVGDDDGDAAAL